jgi:hypothetical protein
MRNPWLRARVIAYGLLFISLCLTSYAFGPWGVCLLSARNSCVDYPERAAWEWGPALLTLIAVLAGESWVRLRRRR